MKTSLPFFLLLTILFSCKDKSPSSDIDVCGVKDPIRNLGWLSNMVTEARNKKQEELLTIVAVEVKGKTVINYYMSYMSCIGCISYNCDGSRFDWSNLTQAEVQEYQKNVWGEGGDKIKLWPEK